MSAAGVRERGGWRWGFGRKPKKIDVSQLKDLGPGKGLPLVLQGAVNGERRTIFISPQDAEALNRDYMARTQGGR